jgi:hypothetical protein
VDATTPPPPAPEPAPSGYVYAGTDIRPRQAREIELCAEASGFDWKYTGAFAAGVVGSVILETQNLKQQEEPGVRLIGPGLVGFAWGGFLSGAYLSLPKCDPLWAGGAPPEGDVRLDWPVAAAITLLAAVTAPAIDYTFLGAVKPEWQDWERASRVFIGMGAGIIGSLFPYVVSPKTWAAKKEIEKIRLQTASGGAFVSYGFVF